MTIKLTDAQRKLFDDKNFAHIATVSEDGSPQVTPVWIEYDGTYVLFNTEQSRAKFKNLKQEPRIAVSVIDMTNPYRYVEVQGVVAEITRDGADETIDRLAKKYMDKDKYPFHKPGDVRVTVKIDPRKVFAMGVE